MESMSRDLYILSIHTFLVLSTVIKVEVKQYFDGLYDENQYSPILGKETSLDRKSKDKAFSEWCHEDQNK